MNRLIAIVCFILLQVAAGYGQGPDLPDTYTALQMQLQSKPDSVVIQQLSRFVQIKTEQGHFDEAIHASQDIMALARRTANPLFMARALISTGFFAQHQGKPAQAVLDFQQAGLIYQRLSDWDRLTLLYQRIGGVYMNIRNLAQAEAYYDKALRLARQHKLSEHMSYLYADMATIYDLRKQFDQALSLNAQSIAISKSIKLDYSSALLNRGIILKNAGRYAESLASYDQALTWAKQHQDPVIEYMVYINRPNTLLLMNRPNEAERDIRWVLQSKIQYLSKEEKLEEVYKTLTGIYEQKGLFKQALTYHKQWVIYRDSVFNAEKSRQLVEAETRFQTREKLQQIQHLNEDNQQQQQQLRLLVGGMLLLILLLGIMAWQYRALRQANRLVNQTLTNLERTQAQLVQQEKLASLGELTAGIAHEIQNPLNFVTNFSEVSRELIDELTQEAQAGHTEDVLAIADDLRQNLQKIQHHGGRASSIVKGMLEHSRKDSGEKRATNLNALADEYVKIAYHGLRAKDKSFTCEIVTKFDTDLGQVEVTPQEIGRVLLNLYNNAFYAVKERQQQADSSYQPTVTVTTVKTKEGVQIRVSDNGTGIPKSVQAKIFQPFFTTKPTGEGTGLGLSLSYDIITKGHGGTLSVTSQPGQGTEFVVSLPTV